MALKTVRNVKEEVWNSMKSEAARQGISMSKYLEYASEGSKKYEELCWDRVLNSQKILSDKEAAELKQALKELRAEKGFRI